MGNAIENLHLPLRANLAGETFAATFMGEETAQTVENLAQIYRLIINLDHARPNGTPYARASS